MNPASLQPAALDSSRARLASLELELAAREHELLGITRELQRLQSAYLAAVGGFYRELVELDAELKDREIRAGLRAVPKTPVEESSGDDDAVGCAHHGAPSGALKSMYRNLAKAIHPDLSLDEPTRWRRHSLMAEANRAYAERDEDRLRLILRTWELSPESVLGDDEEASQSRVRRRISQVEERLLAIEAEFADLRSSAIWQLKQKIDAATAKKWDLLAEMVSEVKREVGRARSKLAKLKLR